jgi:hypothetical protein
MKKLLLGIFTCLSVLSHAQNFEGTIHWKFTHEYKDPATKQKMEQASAQMSDPKNQAQMKEMEQKMKDPQFQKMMEQNPQLKAQMEQLFSSLSKGGGVESMLPKSFVLKFKGGNAITKIEGGFMQSEILYLKDKDQRYSINRAEKKYKLLPKQTSTSDSAKRKVKVTKTNETAKILDYNCTKYIVEQTDSKNNKRIQYIWASTEIKDLNSSSFSKTTLDGNQKFMYEGVEGIPMRFTINTKEVNMTIEMTEINRSALSNSEFIVPAGFTEAK